MKELKRAKGWYEMRLKKYAKKKAAIDKTKVIEFKRFIKRFRRESLPILQERACHILKELKQKRHEIIILAKESKIVNYRKYVNICRKVTKIVIKQENIDVKGRSFESVHIDHIIPIYHAYKMNLSPHLIGMSGNLQKISKEDNLAKGMYQFLLSD